MTIATRYHRRHTVLILTGRCIVSAGETEILKLREVVAELILQGWVRVTANLKGLTCIDARGLGELVRTHRLLQAARGGLTLVGPNPRVRRLLAVTRLDTVLTVCDSDPDAWEESSALIRCPTLLAQA